MAIGHYDEVWLFFVARGSPNCELNADACASSTGGSSHQARHVWPEASSGFGGDGQLRAPCEVSLRAEPTTFSAPPTDSPTPACSPRWRPVPPLEAALFATSKLSGQASLFGGATWAVTLLHAALLTLTCETGVRALLQPRALDSQGPCWGREHWPQSPLHCTCTRRSIWRAGDAERQLRGGTLHICSSRTKSVTWQQQP